MAELLSREAQSFKLVAVLDSDPLRIGTSIAGIDVVSLNQLPVLARTLGIRIGICAIERGPVHSVIEAFIDAGVKAILNCSPNSMPEASGGVYLRTFEPFSDLYLLSHSLASQEP
jgi:redox-sensing transcriptional repressor